MTSKTDQDIRKIVSYNIGLFYEGYHTEDSLRKWFVNYCDYHSLSVSDMQRYIGMKMIDDALDDPQLSLFDE